MGRLLGKAEKTEITAVLMAEHIFASPNMRISEYVKM